MRIVPFSASVVKRGPAKTGMKRAGRRLFVRYRLRRAEFTGIIQSMKALYLQSDIDRLRRQTALWIAAAGGVLVVTLALCIMFCVRTHTANAPAMLRNTILTSILGGWIALTLRIFVIDELCYAKKHTEAMLQGPRETVTGTFTRTDEHIRIRRGVSMQKIQADTEGRTLALQLYDGAAKRFPRTGVVRVETVYGFIVAYEVADDAVD